MPSTEPGPLRNRVLVTVVALISMVVPAIASRVATAPAAASTVGVRPVPVRDATVTRMFPNLNGGRSTDLHARARRPRALSFIQFRVPDGTDVQRAALRLVVQGGSKGQLAVRRAGNGWREGPGTAAVRR